MTSQNGYRTHTIGRVAAKSHRCATRGTWAADHSIRKGDPYLEHIEFPGGESGYATSAGRPVRMAECAACAEACGRGHLLPVRKN